MSYVSRLLQGGPQRYSLELRSGERHRGGTDRRTSASIDRDSRPLPEGEPTRMLHQSLCRMTARMTAGTLTRGYRLGAAPHPGGGGGGGGTAQLLVHPPPRHEGPALLLKDTHYLTQTIVRQQFRCGQLHSPVASASWPQHSIKTS